MMLAESKSVLLTYAFIGGLCLIPAILYPELGRALFVLIGAGFIVYGLHHSSKLRSKRKKEHLSMLIPHLESHSFRMSRPREAKGYSPLAGWAGSYRGAEMTVGLYAPSSGLDYLLSDHLLILETADRRDRDALTPLPEGLRMEEGRISHRVRLRSSEPDVLDSGLDVLREAACP